MISLSRIVGGSSRMRSRDRQYKCIFRNRRAPDLNSVVLTPRLPKQRAYHALWCPVVLPLDNLRPILRQQLCNNIGPEGFKTLISPDLTDRFFVTRLNNLTSRCTVQSKKVLRNDTIANMFPWRICSKVTSGHTSSQIFLDYADTQDC